MQASQVPYLSGAVVLTVAARFYIGFALLICVVGLEPGPAGNSQLRASAVFAADSARSGSEGLAPEELVSYANAKVRVDEIIAFWSESISRSRSADVLRDVRDNEIEIALKLEGLSVARYRAIELIVKEDEDLRAAVAGILKE